MENKHTRGNWVVRTKDVNYPYVIAKNADKIVEFTQNSLSTISEEEALANAKLIAASPRLLECCKIMLNYLEGKELGDSLLARILIENIKEATV